MMKLSIPYDYTAMSQDIRELQSLYSCVEVINIGESILGRKIPLIRIGNRDCCATLYVGTHHAMESITTNVLMQFLYELCQSVSENKKVFGIRPSCLLQNRCLYILPMLNPDGVDLRFHGIAKDNPMKERLVRFNGGSMDFTHWQANARGVDLNHNYNAGFAEYKRLERNAGIRSGAPTRYSGEYPESEPETAALCNFIRITDNVRMVLTLHTQGEEIYYSSGEYEPPAGSRIASLFAGMSGYTATRPDGMAAYGGLTDWFVRTYRFPSFTIECGKGQNPLPQSDATGIYERIREVLFTAPLLT